MKLNQDVLGIILSYLPLTHLIKIYKLGNLYMNNAIANYSFDFYNEFEPIPYDVTLTEFRNMFPLAIGVNLCHRKDITDDEFIANILPRYNPKSKRDRILKINIRFCKNLTNAAFVPLNGLIHTLDMSNCWQEGVTDAAFAHLRGIHTLNMSHCRQAGVTNAAFVHLRGVHTLDMSWCTKAGITDAAFEHLRGVHTLDMSYCWQAGITDEVFAHLRGVHSLNMRGCIQAGVTDATLVHLQSIKNLLI